MNRSFGITKIGRIFIKKFKWILLVTVLTTAVAALLSVYIIPKQYQASALLYVGNRESSSETLSLNDIDVAQKLVNTCQILFTSDSIKARAEAELSAANIVSKLPDVTVSSVNGTEVLRITTTSENPDVAADVTNEMVKLSLQEFDRIIKSGSVEVVEYASAPTEKSFPDNTVFMIIGGGIGLVISVFVFILREFSDIKIKETDDLYKTYNIPVFAEIMDFDAKSKGGYRYE